MKRAPKKPASEKSAVSTLPSDQNAALTILARPQPYPEGLETLVKRFYDINVRPDGEFFRLYDGSAPCGSRLIKSEGFPLEATDVPVKPWEVPYFRFRSLPAATSAATELQRYLDCHENPKLKAELNRIAAGDFIRL